MTLLIYKYSQLTDSDVSEYSLSMKICRGTRTSKLHLGQLKLFFAELIFLSKYAKPGCKILYVGAAEGYHISKLASMFNECTFDLWDPRDFDLEKRPNINIFQEFFTDDSARTYQNNRTDDQSLLFMCDLRNLSIGSAKNDNNIDKMDEITDEDMVLQARWCKIFKPDAAYLKFRLPYEIPKSSYLTGTIYFQPYTKISTECRLLTKNYDKYETYDNDQFNNMLAWHNINRCTNKNLEGLNKIWSEILLQYNLYQCWDTYYALTICHKYLKSLKNISSKKACGELFMDIINFHIKKYGKKYAALFNNYAMPSTQHTEI